MSISISGVSVQISSRIVCVNRYYATERKAYEHNYPRHIYANTITHNLLKQILRQGERLTRCIFNISYTSSPPNSLLNNPQENRQKRSKGISSIISLNANAMHACISPFLTIPFPPCAKCNPFTTLNATRSFKSTCPFFRRFKFHAIFQRYYAAPCPSVSLQRKPKPENPSGIVKRFRKNQTEPFHLPLSRCHFPECSLARARFERTPKKTTLTKDKKGRKVYTFKVVKSSRSQLRSVRFASRAFVNAVRVSRSMHSSPLQSSVS